MVELILTPRGVTVTRTPLTRPRRHPGRAALDEVAETQRAKVLTVHVQQLLHVEERRRVRNVAQSELFDERRERHDLFVAAWTPPEQRQVVHESLGKVSLVAVGLGRDGVPAFRAF